MIDIVIPNNNEEEFISIARKLDYTSLFFLYEFDEFFEKQKKFENSKIINFGILATSKNLDKIKNILEKQSFSSELKDKKIFVAIKSPNIREIIEKSKVNAKDLVDKLRSRSVTAMHIYPFEAIVEHLEVICRPGDLVVIMGAGPVWKIGRAFLSNYQDVAVGSVGKVSTEAGN